MRTCARFEVEGASDHRQARSLSAKVTSVRSAPCATLVRRLDQAGASVDSENLTSFGSPFPPTRLSLILLLLRNDLVAHRGGYLVTERQIVEFPQRRGLCLARLDEVSDSFRVSPGFDKGCAQIEVNDRMREDLDDSLVLFDGVLDPAKDSKIAGTHLAKLNVVGVDREDPVDHLDSLPGNRC